MTEKSNANEEINLNLKIKLCSTPKEKILFEPEKLIFFMNRYKSNRITELSTKNITERSNDRS